MPLSRVRALPSLRSIVPICGVLVALDTAYAALFVTEVVSPTVGTVLGGASNRHFILNTDETVTGADAADYMFGAVSGELRVRKTMGPALANIVAENITATGGVVVVSVPCRWRNRPQQACDNAGINVLAVGNRRLYVGVEFRTSQFHSGGDTASVSYDITVTLF
jgi:hypothetical protein